MGVFKMFGGCFQDVWWVFSRCLVGVFKICGGCLQDFGSPKELGAGEGQEGWRAQNFALFFLSPAAKFVLSTPLWGSSRGILVVFEAPWP